MALTDYRPMMERCSNCLGCKWVPFDKVQSLRFGQNCPSISYYNFNTYAARGRFQLAQNMLDELAPWSDTVTEVVHTCTACGACDVSCKICRYNLEPLDHNLALKAYAVEAGHTLPAAAKVMASLKSEKTMVPGAKKAKRMDWAKGLKLKDLTKEKAEVAFFAGCKFSYTPELQPAARKAAEVLLKAGVDMGTFDDADMCCAGRAQQMGYFADFEKQAEANLKLFKKAGIKTIVTPCSDCYHTFKRLYAKMGLEIQVFHVAECLDDLLQKGKLKLKKTVPLTVTYHDPCHLGRQGEPYEPWEGKEVKILNQVHTWEPRRPRYIGNEGVYDAPRRVLEAIPGVRLIEMERIREYAWCCGAGGGCNETYPEFSSWTASERITEANATGAEALVTACPWCEANFAGATDENGNAIPVLDIIELVAGAL